MSGVQQKLGEITTFGVEAGEILEGRFVARAAVSNDPAMKTMTLMKALLTAAL